MRLKLLIHLVFAILLLLHVVSCSQDSRDRSNNHTPLSEKGNSISQKEKEKRSGNQLPQNPITLTQSEPIPSEYPSRVPDYFEIPTKLARNFSSGENAKWFIDPGTQSRLYLIPYADGSITTALLSRADLPIDERFHQLLIGEGVKVNSPDMAIAWHQIQSKDGISIGTSPAEAVEIYGVPTSAEKNDGVDLFLWKFRMKEPEEPVPVGGLRPLVIDILTFEVELTFLRGHLIQALYQYDIP